MSGERGMLAGILRFEWRYHTRRVTFAASAAAMAAFAVILVATGYGPPAVNVNAPYVVAQAFGLLTLPAVFVLTIFCADAALRDVEHGMTELIFSRPVGKRRYLAGRFAGALLAAITVMLVAALVLMVAPLVLRVDPERVGAVRPAAYLWALLLVTLPNLLLVGAVQFGVAALTRSTLATYVGAVGIYAAYFVAALLVDSPLMGGSAPPTADALARAALLDPFGLSAFFEQTRYWTPDERDVRLVAASGRMLLNRLLVIGVATAILAATYARFSLRVVGASPRSRRARWMPSRAATAAGARSDGHRAVAPATRGTFWPALRSATRGELRHVLRGWTFVALLAMWAFVAGMEATAQLGGGEYGSRVLPTTGLIVNAMHLPLLLVGTVTIVYYAAEVAWRERLVGIDPLVDATPAPSAVFYLSKAAALCALPLVMALVAIGVGVVVQLAHGYGRVEPVVYLSLLWFGGVPLALFAVAALALQAASANRWIGMLAGVALALVARRGESLGLEHPMLRFGAAPDAPHSDMDGFGPVPASFAAFVLYWGAAAAVLACVSWGMWRRGLDPGLGARLAALPRRLGRGGVRALALSAALLASVGGTLLWRTSVAHGWESRDARAAWRADYERAYRRVARVPQPDVVDVRLVLDLDPPARRARVRATLALENRSAAPIDTLWVVVRRDVDSAAVFVDGARLARRDARFGVHVFAMARPLAPGARASLRYAGTLDRAGVRATAHDYDVTANGTFLSSGDLLPSLGYRHGYEIGDPAERRARGLAPSPTEMPPLPATDSARARVRGDAWLTLDATVSTSADQTVIASGRLVRAWRADGRRWFRYVADRPITPLFAVTSARLAVRRVRHRGVDVEVWHHPSHDANVGRMLDAATRSLDVLGARFGAYPHAALRIAEVPAWCDFGALATTGAIFFPEDRGLLADARGGARGAGRGVDLVARRVAHEVAHQWWGHALDAAPVAGATTLHETLAKHAEQLVIAAMHGEGALAPMLAFDEDRYLARSAEERGLERTLLDATGQPYLYYGKGAVVMHALRDLLGAAAVDRALARLLSAHGGPGGAPTTLDLRDALRAESGSAADRALVDEWLGGRTVYDLRADSAAAVAIGGGRWRVAARFRARKTERVEGGEAARSADGEALDVAVYDDRPEVGRVLWAGKARVGGGALALSIDVEARPAYVVVDPFVRRIDRDRGDNRARVAMPGGAR